MTGFPPRTPSGLAKKMYSTKLDPELIEQLRALGPGKAAAFIDKALRKALKK